MGLYAWALDGDSYTGRQFRQTMTPWLSGATPSRPLGGRSGVRVGSGAPVAVTASTWTVGPHSGVIDNQVAAEAGPYPYSIDAAVSGSLTAADATSTRTDIVWMRVNDPAESDGSSVPAVVVGYTPGVPGSGVAPSTPSGSLRLGVITVPRAGGGNPAVSWVAPWTVAAGGTLPCLSSARPPVPYQGQMIYETDTGLVQVNQGGSPSSWAALHPDGATRRWTASRTGASDNFSSGSFVSLLGVGLGVTAPAGSYLLTTNFDLGSTVGTTGNLRIIDPNKANLSADRTINPILSGQRTPVTYSAGFDWGGGAGTVTVSVMVSSGIGTIINPSARLDVFWVGG